MSGISLRRPQDDEEEEEPEKQNVIAATTFAAYRQLSLSNSNSADDLTALDPALSKTKEAIQRSSDDCVICYARVKSDQAVWECVQCFIILHLSCIQSYVRRRVLPANAAAARELFPSRIDPPWLWYACSLACWLTSVVSSVVWCVCVCVC